MGNNYKIVMIGKKVILNFNIIHVSCESQAKYIMNRGSEFQTLKVLSICTCNVFGWLLFLILVSM